MPDIPWYTRIETNEDGIVENDEKRNEKFNIGVFGRKSKSLYISKPWNAGNVYGKKNRHPIRRKRGF